MKPLLPVLLALLGCSCASTYATKDRVNIQSNAERVEWHGGANPSLVIVKLNNSIPTRAGGSVIGTTGMAVAGGIMAAATHGIAR